MPSKKEPPNKYQCLKLPISSILYKDNEEVKENMEILQKAIIRTNAITTKTYFLLRFFINIIIIKKFLKLLQILFLCV